MSLLEINLSQIRYDSDIKFNVYWRNKVYLHFDWKNNYLVTMLYYF